MKHVLLTILLLWGIFLPGIGQENQMKKVAILETVDKEGSINYGVKLMVRSNLAAAITSTPGYEGYDRVDVASIMSEQSFQRTGMVSDAQIKKLGEMTGAAYILVAEAAKIDEANIFITAKILNVETAKLERTSNVQTGIKAEELQKGCRQLSILLFGGTTEREIAHNQKNGNDGVSAVKKEIEETNGVYFEFTFFEGGSLAEDNDNAVDVNSFYVCFNPITQSDWEKIMGVSKNSMPKMVRNTIIEDLKNKGLNPTEGNIPLTITYKEAEAFAKKLSEATGKKYCLPTSKQTKYIGQQSSLFLSGWQQNDKRKGSLVNRWLPVQLVLIP